VEVIPVLSSLIRRGGKVDWDVLVAWFQRVIEEVARSRAGRG